MTGLLRFISGLDLNLRGCLTLLFGKARRTWEALLTRTCAPSIVDENPIRRRQSLELPRPPAAAELRSAWKGEGLRPHTGITTRAFTMRAGYFRRRFLAMNSTLAG